MSDKILHWWKLNSIYDEGVNDEDFYALWSSIAYMYALVYGQSNQFLDIKGNEKLVERFLETFGVIVGESTTPEDVNLIFDSWLDEVRKRGSRRMLLRKGTSKGMCLNIPTPYLGFTNTGDTLIDLTNMYEVSFDWKFSANYMSNTINGYLIKGVNCVLLPVTQNYMVKFLLNVNPELVDVTFFNSSDGGVYSTQFLADGSLYKVKIVRNVTDLYIYINGSLVFEGVSVLNSTSDCIEKAIVFDYATFIHGVTGKVANISVKNYSSKYVFVLNEMSYVLSDRLGSGRMSYMFSTLQTPYESHSLDQLFAFDDDFNNLPDYSQYDSEVVRLLGGVDGEFLFPLCGKVDLDWVINSSSPGVVQSYPIVNFNKLPSLRSTLEGIAIQYGKKNNEALGCVTTYLRDDGQYALKVIPQAGASGEEFDNYYGISLKKGSIQGYYYSYPVGLYVIPIDTSIDYEISFRLKCENSGITSFLFEVLAFDELYQLVDLKSAKDGSTENRFVVNYFGANFLSNYVGKEIWVRGILYNSAKVVGEDMSSLNMNFPPTAARNLIFNSNVKYIYPSILFSNTTIETNAVHIWDVQVRPLSVNVSKGTVGVKDVFLPVLKNNSTFSNSYIVRLLRKLFIPYSGLMKVRFLSHQVHM